MQAAAVCMISSQVHGVCLAVADVVSSTLPARDLRALRAQTALHAEVMMFPQCGLVCAAAQLLYNAHGVEYTYRRPASGGVCARVAVSSKHPLGPHTFVLQVCAML